MKHQILYEDNHMLIVNKRAGQIVQGDKTGDEPMVETLKRYLKEKYNKPGKVFTGVIHRLDRPVSGVVIFAKTSKALARMNAMMQKREVKKVYWAVVATSPPSPLSKASPPGPLSNLERGNRGLGGEGGEVWILLTHFLKKNEQQNKSYVHEGPGPGRLKAELKYRLIARSDRYELLEIELLTGRHHQIRAQLSYIGMAIKGDLKYGYPRSNPDGSIHLHSRLVEFTHPVSGEFVSVTAPVPEERVWQVLAAI